MPFFARWLFRRLQARSAKLRRAKIQSSARALVNPAACDSRLYLPDALLERALPSESRQVLRNSQLLCYRAYTYGIAKKSRRFDAQCGPSARQSRLQFPNRHCRCQARFRARGAERNCSYNNHERDANDGVKAFFIAVPFWLIRRGP
jgi:hypothetical protein